MAGIKCQDSNQTIAVILYKVWMVYTEFKSQGSAGCF